MATIGVETKYGRNTGDYRVIDALSNLAFGDTTRAPYFKKELEEFLLLTREQHSDPLKIMGSYAGAIGQPQFMPSSYRRYAIAFSGNRSIDLSHNEIDVIGSIANYYAKHGWKSEKLVVIPASVSQSHDYETLMKENQFFTKAMLEKYGFNFDDRYLSQHQKVKLLRLQGYNGNEYWLSFPNFDVIKKYNNSDLYAMSVYQLSYYITALREKVNHA